MCCSNLSRSTPAVLCCAAGILDPTGAYLYGAYEHMALSQAEYGAMPQQTFSSREELKQHASSYVQQQLAMMGHPPTSRHASGGGSSSQRESVAGFGMQGPGHGGAGWQGGYSSSGAAAAGASGGSKKGGRGRGRPPGSKSNQQTHSAADTSLDASAAAATAEQQQQMYQSQQQYSMNGRISQDEAATWCSTGMMLARSAAAAAAGGDGVTHAGPGGSPGVEVHSSATYMMPQQVQQSSAVPAAAAATEADPLDPAALAAAPVPLSTEPLEGASDVHAPVSADPAAAAHECLALLPTSGAATVELSKLPQFRVSMTGLDYELERAGAGSSMRFSARSLKLFECEDGACMPTYKASISNMDFRTSLASLDEILGNNAAARMSEHTHIGLRGPSWDGGSSPRSQTLDAAAGGSSAAVSRAPAAAVAAAYGGCSAEADHALSAAFKQQPQQQQQQGLMLPPGSTGMGHSSWVAAQQAPSSAAIAAAAAATSSAAQVPCLNSVHSGSFTFPAAAPAHASVHPGALAAPAEDAGVPLATAGSREAHSPFGASMLQEAPFSPVPDAAAEDTLPAPSAVPLREGPARQGPQATCTAGAGAAGQQGYDHRELREHPMAPRMPPAFHTVLQALQPPAAPAATQPLGCVSTGPMVSTVAVVPSGPGYNPSEALHQQQQQQRMAGPDPALAAASPAITGTCSGAAAGSMGPLAFLMPPAAAAGGYQQQQMPMPMPMAPHLLLPPQHTQGPGPRLSDLPLPSPIDLFHGDHGLHTDDLLIDAGEVFDERMLDSSSAQHYQHMHQQQQLFLQQQRVQASMQMQHSHDAAAAAQQYKPVYNSAPAHYARRHVELQAAAAHGMAAGGAHLDGMHAAGYGMQQQHPCAASARAHAAAQQQGTAGQVDQADAGGRHGVKRRRSSTNGAAWSKKQRPSEGSLVEVYPASHGMDDCLHFWHHD